MNYRLQVTQCYLGGFILFLQGKEKGKLFSDGRHEAELSCGAM